jgi:hypothetical protein
MKKTVFLSLFISFKIVGQSVTISPQTIAKEDNSTDDLSLTSYQFPSTIFGRRANGTALSKTAVQSGDFLFRINGSGWDGSSFPNGGRISFKATQNWAANNGGALLFETTPNTSFLPMERMIINHDGNVGIGLTSPNQILDINGRMRIRHTPGFTSGVWMSNSTNGLTDADGAFIGLNTDTQAGIYIGNAWRFGFNSNGNAVITGFTQLGNSVPAGAAAGATAPSIKTLKLTGTTGATQGASASVTHGLSLSKILSYSVLVNIGGSVPSLIPPENTSDTALKYTVFCTGSSIFLLNTSGSSSGLLSKPFTVLITYEE